MSSHTYVYKKLDEFGTDYDKAILDAIEEQGGFMQQKAEIEVEKNAEPSSNQGNRRCYLQDIGRKLVFDNVDYHQEVHHMTEDHQNVHKHCVTIMAVENRVSANHLSYKQPECGIMGFQNGKCLPSCFDNKRQRDNYIAIVGRVISTHIKCMNRLSDAAVHHIPHVYTKEMSMKSDLVSNEI